MVTIPKSDNYYFNKQEMLEEYDNNKVYIVDKEYNKIIEFLQNIGYSKEEFEEYYILK